MTDTDWIRDCKNITRVEVIERGIGRHYVDHNVKNVVISLQDDGRTLKVFVREEEEDG